MRKKWKQLLIATLAATSLTWQGGVVYADAKITDEHSSGNEITTTETNIKINDTTTDYTSETLNNGKFFFENFYGGISGDFDYGTYSDYKNKGLISSIRYSGDDLLVFIMGGIASSGNVTGNVININGGNFYDGSWIYGGAAQGDDPPDWLHLFTGSMVYSLWVYLSRLKVSWKKLACVFGLHSGLPSRAQMAPGSTRTVLHVEHDMKTAP